jgi:hypothetical protein
MSRLINILTWLFVIVVVVAVFLHNCQHQKLKAELTGLSDEQYLTVQLAARNADDCHVTPIDGGWRCEEFKTGKIYIVKR